MQSAISDGITDLTVRMATGFTGVADGPDESLVDAWRPIRSRIDPTVAARDGTSRADRNAGETVVRTGVVSRRSHRTSLPDHHIEGSSWRAT